MEEGREKGERKRERAVGREREGQRNETKSDREGRIETKENRTWGAAIEREKGNGRAGEGGEVEREEEKKMENQRENKNPCGYCGFRYARDAAGAAGVAVAAGVRSISAARTRTENARPNRFQTPDRVN